MEEMEINSSFVVFAGAAVILSGLSKGGFAGLGALAMPIMVLGVSPVRAAAIMLPILVLQDLVGVFSFRKTWDRGALLALLPGMVCGVALGYFFAAEVSEKAVLGMVGVIALLFGLRGLGLGLRGTSIVPSSSPLWIGTLFGAASGFSSQIAHAGSPPLQMWLIPRGLPRDVFVGTSTIAFAFVNIVKIPAYIALGQLTYENLWISQMLLPVALISTIVGVWLVRRIDPARFYRLIYGLMTLLGAKLVFDAI